MFRLYKYRSFTTGTDRKRLKRILIRHELYCPTPVELNDPYDCNIGTADQFIGQLIKFGVFCTSGEKHNDILLFSHYADKHTGLCLVFQVDTERIIAETSFLGFSERVNYVQDFPKFDGTNIHHLPKTKYFVWEYEDEYRVLADLESRPSKFRSFEKDELVEVRFGLEMKEQDQQLIKQWSNLGGLSRVRFSKADLRQDTFQLSYSPL